MSLLDKWDTDYVRSYKELGHISIAAFYYVNDPEDCVHFHFSWSKQVDNLMGDSLFEALNRTPTLSKSFEQFGETRQFSMKMERAAATRVSENIQVDIEITQFPDSDEMLNAA